MTDECANVNWFSILLWQMTNIAMINHSENWKWNERFHLKRDNWVKDVDAGAHSRLCLLLGVSGHVDHKVDILLLLLLIEMNWKREVKNIIYFHPFSWRHAPRPLQAIDFVNNTKAGNSRHYYCCASQKSLSPTMNAKTQLVRYSVLFAINCCLVVSMESEFSTLKKRFEQAWLRARVPKSPADQILFGNPCPECWPVTSPWKAKNIWTDWLAAI